MRKARGGIMPDSTSQGERPQQESPRSYLYLFSSVAIGILFFAVGLAICGLIGRCRTEYQVGRVQQAILLALGWSWYGALPGLGVGFILNWRMRRRSHN